MLDTAIIRFMENKYADDLDADFVRNHYPVACGMFNPYRTDLPEHLRQYGFPIGTCLAASEFAPTEDDPLDEQDRIDYPPHHQEHHQQVHQHDFQDNHQEHRQQNHQDTNQEGRQERRQQGRQENRQEGRQQRRQQRRQE
ncbi:hypothetical protein FisN_18Hu019 [Fistulifera solaris]|jgi:hypothetical protein|uniref:Uncharacterized protein n=1 Tax=Fistulifera solaris TaxID=1519565 RepID=A0A1Z5JV73_FISSO|nr:hypothetical protein FisN_18Hu019 [Fistulifera solaris]|eukprot:GAX17819.1 hypothetical protein FisN_18Hu019 [Fistulifera solaris]